MRLNMINHKICFCVLTVVVSLLVFSSSPAYAFCPSGTGPWALDDLPLPVYLNNNLDDLICSTSDCSSFAQLRRSTDVTLDEYYDNSGSKLRLFYAGTTDADIGEVIDNSIHVFASNNCTDAPGVAAWGDTDADGTIDFGKVRMCANFRGRPVSWESFPSVTSSIPPLNYSWQGVMAHEVGHTLGFDHPEVCSQNFKSIMGTTQANTEEGHHLYKDDIDAYQTTYLFRSDKDVNFKQSANGLDWGNGFSPPDDMKVALSRLSASNTSASPATFVSFPSDAFPRFVDVWRYDAGRWKHLPTPFLAATNYHTGTASRDSLDEAAVAWLGGYNNITGRQSVFLSTTTNAGTTWNLKVIADGVNQTTNAGLGATYDPESGNYVVVWRDSFDRITSRVDAPDAPIRNYLMTPGGNQFLRASDSVSISCGPSDVVGPENCIVAWSDTGWNRTLRWAHAHVDISDDGPQLKLGPIHGQGYIIFGTPSVSYWSNGQFPWELVFHQGGRTAYSLQKTASIDADWQNERSFSGGNKIVSPAIGSRTGPQLAGGDIIVQWVHAFFTSSSSP